MMKIEYSKPEVEVIELSLDEIIATSEEFDLTIRDDYDGEEKDGE